MVTDLLGWYKQNKRNLPWRRSADPYRIWVSEVMLQQTRVEAVIPYFERFIERFPTIDALASAAEEDVLKLWEGLGYYSRARNLQNAVREVAEQYGGVVPDSYEAMLGFRGVGAYTAGAVLSIAYNQSIPAVDGNVLRVFARLFRIEQDISLPRVRKEVELLASELIPSGDASSFNQAIMELGALICIPRSPRCIECPVQMHCRAYEQGVQTQLPIKKAKAAVRELSYVVVVLVLDDKVLVRKRPDKGLLRGLWELPMIPVEDATVPLEELLVQHEKNEKAVPLAQSEETVQTADVIELVIDKSRVWEDRGMYTHVFSHIRWNLRVLVLTCDAATQVEVPFGHFADEQERSKLTFGRVFQQILHDVLGDGRIVLLREGEQNALNRN